MTIDIPCVVQQAGGEVSGKVRLQKLVYLLSHIGVKTGYSFTYHHYGPYSEELAEAVEDDVIFGRLQQEPRHRKSDGVSFVAYKVPEGQVVSCPSVFSDPHVKEAVELMQRCSATILELAATIHWLWAVEKVANWHDELIRRKGVKTENGRTVTALQLLEKLGVAPPDSSKVIRWA